MSAPAAAFTLRQLPLPAKLVVTCFLLAVGLGYTSAMIQLHMQHSARDGSHMPTPDDVAAVFAGKMKPKGDGQAGPCRLEEILPEQPTTGGLTAKNMTPAFYAQDAATYVEEAKKPGRKATLDAERNGERLAVVAWVRAAPADRREAFEKNKFPLPPDLRGKPLTAGYKTDDEAVRIEQLIKDRCCRCHKPGGDKSDVPLTTYEELAKFMPAESGPDRFGYVDSGKKMSLEKLTQSTHAHLLSFAVLFSLTGIVFAFTGYPKPVRLVLAPLVLVAQVADVSFWWLARVPDYGVFFAYGIVGTGTVVGLGLGAQIMLSLFSMYGPAGRAVLVGLFAVGGAAGGAAYVAYVKPHLEDEARAKKAAAEAAARKPDAKPGEYVPTRLERLLTGTIDAKPKWNGNADGGMLRALFDKEDAYEQALKKKAPGLDKLTAERAGEQDVLLAWLKLPDEARRKAFEADRLDLPAAPPVKALTDAVTVGDAPVKLRADDKAVRVRSLFVARCATCHGEGGEKADIPLETYDQIAGYLTPAPNPLAGTKSAGAEAKADPEPKKAADSVAGPPKPEPPAIPKAAEEPAAAPGPTPGPTAAGPASQLEALVSGTFEKGFSRWSGVKAGGMVRAFFDKEEAFKDALKAGGPELPKLTAERAGEQAALIAWARAAPAARQAAYKADRFPLPAELAGKPLTADFRADDKAVKVKSLIDARCVGCHVAGGEKEDAPLETFEQLDKYFGPPLDAKPGR